MKETEQTLFIKSNLLHIRTNEGEFEVSNPEFIFQDPEKKRDSADMYIAYKILEGTEWPYGVELIKMCASDVCDTDGSCEHCREPKTVARLLPKEEKKAESAYKEVESSEPQEELKKGDAGFKWFTCPTCDGRGSVPQDSAPSESQEEMWKIVYGASNTITRDGFIESMKEHFKITRKPE